MEEAIERLPEFCWWSARGVISFTGSPLPVSPSLLAKTRMSLRAKLPLLARPGPLCFIDLWVSASIRSAVTLGRFTFAVTTQRSSLGFLPERRREPSFKLIMVAPSRDFDSTLSSIDHGEEAGRDPVGLSNHSAKRPGNSSCSNLSRATTRVARSLPQFSRAFSCLVESSATSISLRMVWPNVETRR